MSRLLYILCILPLVLLGCNGSEEITNSRVRQISVAFQGSFNPCEKGKVIASVDYILRHWENYFGMASRPITITFVEGDYWIIFSVSNINGQTVYTPVQLQEQFYQGANYAKVIAGTNNTCPMLWHLLCHINLVAASPLSVNPISGSDLADMQHTHVDWPTWDSQMQYGAPIYKQCP